MFYVRLLRKRRGVRYGYEQLRSLIPKEQPQSLPLSLPPLTLGSVPLEECLSKTDRDLIISGVGEGSRNDSGAKLARHLIGTSVRLQHLGERFSGDPRQLFNDYCARCSPPLDAKEADQIWKSAQSDNPTATLTDDALTNCIKAWQRRQQVTPSTSTSKVAQLKTPTEVPLKERILEIISRGLKSSEEKTALLELAKQTNNQPRACPKTPII